MCESDQPVSTPFLDQVADHRKLLQTLKSEMQSAYDKGVMALSGGALGVSLNFLKEFVPRQNIQGVGLLMGAWISWGLSVAIVVFSFYTSTIALGKAIDQTDDNLLYYDALERGGKFNKVTHFLNNFSGALFVVGLTLLLIFAAKNL